MYKIYSTSYLEQEVSSYCCYMNEALWKRIMNDQNTSRMFARIVKDNKYWICSVGHPIQTSFEPNSVFVPSWMLEQIQCNGYDEELEIDWFPSEAFDHSTKIVLQPFDTAFQIGDIQEQLSYELTKLGILQKSTNIVIQMPELGGFEVTFNVKGVEPASVVLCQGDEVELEFDYSLIEEPVARPPSPYPHDLMPETLIPEPFVPENSSIPSGSTLGGEKKQERYNPWRNKDFKPNTS
uniref:Uncharacterized protein n=1 Tax=viral metagenome TaxID=1070528 RepID=A0A6C0D7R2_9ZZZZ